MSEQIKISNLKTSYEREPMSLDVLERHVFSWRMESERTGARQTAYQIIVEEDGIDKRQVWDSGRVSSNDSLHISYEGIALKEQVRYYWTVTVWACFQGQEGETEVKSKSFFETGLSVKSWEAAKWIKSGGKELYSKEAGYNEQVINPTIMFAKQFNADDMSAGLKRARIYSTALGIYDLYLNGERVGGDELKPGWTKYDKTVLYYTYDITDMIRQDKNVIVAEVGGGWYNGSISNSAVYNKGERSFTAQIHLEYTDGRKESVCTDTTWRCFESGATIYADIYHGERYDARRPNAKACSMPEYDVETEEWAKVLPSEEFLGEIKGHKGPTIKERKEMQRCPQTVVKYRGIKKNESTYGEINIVEERVGKSIFQNLMIGKGETLIFDFGQNMTGWERINVKGAAGASVRIRFSEMLNDSGEESRKNDCAKGTIYRSNYRSARSEGEYILMGDPNGETYSPQFTFYGFRYMELTASEAIEILNVSACVVGSETQEGSFFKTDKEDINRLYENVIWGQRSNFLSIPTDCPQRDERLGWTGDTQMFVRTASYNADVAGFFRKWMGDMRDSQRSDGAYPDVAPQNEWVGYGQAAWADAGIIVPWTMYLMYKDLEVVRENYESMVRYMDFLRAQGDEEYLFNGAGTNYGDWVAYEHTDRRYISVVYYAYVAGLMAKMSAALDYQAKAEEYTALYNDIKREFISRYVNEDGTLKEESQTAYLLALFAELFPNEAAVKNGLAILVDKIQANGTKLATGFVGTGILNQTLSRYGAIDIAYDLLVQRDNPSWLYSVDQGATTIWERWNSYTKESGFHPDGMNSFNHYAYGAVCEWMFRFAAGIEADENNPGFKHIILRPGIDLGGHIGRVEAKYTSYYGEIKVVWDAVTIQGRVVYMVTIPANTTATLYLPQFKAGVCVGIEAHPLVSGSYVFEIEK